MKLSEAFLKACGYIFGTAIIVGLIVLGAWWIDSGHVVRGIIELFVVVLAFATGVIYYIEN